MSVTECGNPRHPHGPWHTASPIASDRRGRRAQKRNRRRHGCTCEPHQWVHIGFWFRCSDCGEVA